MMMRSGASDPHSHGLDLSVQPQSLRVKKHTLITAVNDFCDLVLG